MRRALPWLLVGLVAVGAGIGMGIGIAGQSPTAQAQISQIVRTTEEAGTARYTIAAAVRTGSSSRLQIEFFASGQINFKTHSISMTLHYPSGVTPSSGADVLVNPNLKVIETGRFLYVYLPNVSALGSVGTTGKVAYSWEREPFSNGLRHGSGIVDGPLNLLRLPGSVRVLQDLGPTVVGGQEATEYQLGTSTCKAKANNFTQTYSNSPTTLWVDSHGRLIEGEVTQSVVIESTKRTSVGEPGPTDKVSVRLFDFGAPEDITAPTSTTAGSPIIEAANGCPI